MAWVRVPLSSSIIDHFVRFFEMDLSGVVSFFSLSSFLPLFLSFFSPAWSLHKRREREVSTRPSRLRGLSTRELRNTFFFFLFCTAMARYVLMPREKLYFIYIVIYTCQTWRPSIWPILALIICSYIAPRIRFELHTQYIIFSSHSILNPQVSQYRICIHRYRQIKALVG